MSATEQMRQMLDQLMGTAREGESKRSRYDFTDERVCRSFLLDCCPHDIFASTRMDLGECKKVHDLALRADYEKASKTKDYGFEIDAYKTLQDFVQNSDRKIELSKKRLAESKEELNNEKFNRDHELAEQIGKKLAEAEKEGAEGNVEQSLKLMEEVEQLKKQKEIAENEYKNSVPSSNFQKQKLRVCEVCSAYLDIYDNDRRLADHFGGKLHLGYITVREKYESLKEIVNNRRKERLRERRDLSRSPPDRNREKRRRDDRYENDRDSRRYNHRESNDRRYNRDRSRSRERRSPRSNDRYDRNSSASYSSRNSREKR